MVTLFCEFNMVQSSKIWISLGVCGLLGTVGYSAVYLPFYSDLSQKAAQRTNKLRDGIRGSMWSNMDKSIKDGKSNSQ